MGCPAGLTHRRDENSSEALLVVKGMPEVERGTWMPPLLMALVVALQDRRIESFRVPDGPPVP